MLLSIKRVTLKNRSTDILSIAGTVWAYFGEAPVQVACTDLTGGVYYSFFVTS
jgi:hypothetical protein